MSLSKTEDWTLLAKCRGMQDELFPEGADQKRIRAVCYSCKVRNQCLAEALDIDRKTVARYYQWAAEQHLLEGPLPPPDDLHRLVEETLSNSPPPQNISSVEPYRATVEKLRQSDVEVAAIYERLKERGYTGSYASVYRFVRALEPPTPEVTVRVETRPQRACRCRPGAPRRGLAPIVADHVSCANGSTVA